MESEGGYGDRDGYKRQQTEDKTPHPTIPALLFRYGSVFVPVHLFGRVWRKSSGNAAFTHAGGSSLRWGTGMVIIDLPKLASPLATGLSHRVTVKSVCEPHRSRLNESRCQYGRIASKVIRPHVEIRLTIRSVWSLGIFF